MTSKDTFSFIVMLFLYSVIRAFITHPDDFNGPYDLAYIFS